MRSPISFLLIGATWQLRRQARSKTGPSGFIVASTGGGVGVGVGMGVGDGCDRHGTKRAEPAREDSTGKALGRSSGPRANRTRASGSGAGSKGVLAPPWRRTARGALARAIHERRVFQ